MIELRDILVLRDGRAILEIPSWSLEQQRVQIVEGRNGAGKTTMLLVMHGMIPPDAGTLRYRGVPVRGGTAVASAMRRETGLLFQDAVLFDTSVNENIWMPLRARGIPRRAARMRIAEALEAVGLLHLQRRAARTLSGGEARRAALARLLALRPKLLLLDEPGAHIDAEGTDALVRALKSYTEGGGTIVYTTPGDRLDGLDGSAVRLENGRIVQQ